MRLKAKEETSTAGTKEYLRLTAVCKKPLKVNSSHTPAKEKAIISVSNPRGELVMLKYCVLTSSTVSLVPKTEIKALEMTRSNRNTKAPKATPNRIVLGFTSKPI